MELEEEGRMLSRPWMMTGEYLEGMAEDYLCCCSVDAKVPRDCEC